jgi:hypothetical protein
MGGQTVASLPDDDDEDLDDDELAKAEEEREELADALREARRKPRQFAIFIKGADVVAMIAQRKPLRAAALRKARRDSGGKQIVQGVCEKGDGGGLVFKVAGDVPKVKKSKLREFISQATGLMIKPRFESSSSKR